MEFGNVATQAVNSAVVIGFVNVVSLFVDIDSKKKAGLALFAALFVVFVPLTGPVGQIVQLLFGSSGAYKALQVLGVKK